jgi:predicted alpha/beta hydrolase
MLHGAIENGKIFYSKSGKGFGPFLANKGFDVFIADIRGKGESTPKVSKKLNHSQTELITLDVPKSLDKIKEITGKDEFHFVSHSWGGVILYAFLARFHKQYKIKSQVMFAGKRRISVISPKRILHADIIWNLYGKLSGALLGYIPFKYSKIGSENEPKTMFKQMNKWVYSKDWVDMEDDFDYSKALHKIDLPPTLHLTGIKDDVLGNPIDVELLRKEAGEHQESELSILGKNYGNQHDYDHINILTHPLAKEDHFITAYEWIKNND